jgi:hypothetical protein
VCSARIDQRFEVIERAMHASVGEQAEEVQRSAARLHVCDARAQRGVGGERAVGHRGVDHDQPLRDDAAAADVDVADFAIAHHAGGQPHRFAAGLECGVRVTLEHALPVRQLGFRDRVAVRIVAQAPAVENREDERWAPAHPCARALTIRS